VAFSPDGAAVATADSAGVIRLWESAGARPGPVLAGHPSRVNGLAFSPDGRLLASGGAGGEVKVWHLGSRRELLNLPASAGGEVTEVAFSPDGVALAAAYRRPSGPGGVALWVAAPP
jgi:WD40 repeat protein